MTRSTNFHPEGNDVPKSLFDVVKSSKFKQTLTGVTFIFIGLLGLLLPILPGWALIFMGLVLLFPRWGKKIILKIIALFKLESSDTPK